MYVRVSHLFSHCLHEIATFLELDLIPFTVTLLSSLFLGLEYGIIIGIGTNLLFILYNSSRPPVQIEREKFFTREIYLVTPSRELQFPSAEYVREKIMKDCDCIDVPIVIDGKYVGNIDATVAKVSQGVWRTFSWV